MNRDDIIRMAREADPAGEDGRLYAIAELTPKTLERFATMVAAAEREACAQTARTAMLGAEWVLTERVMKSIRARGNT